MNQHPEQAPTSVNALNELVRKNQADREKMVGLVAKFRTAFAAERARAETAIAQVLTLSKENEDLKGQVFALTKIESQLSREVATMAAAIAFANNEIAASDEALLDAVEVVDGEISIGFDELHPELTPEAVEAARAEAQATAEREAEARTRSAIPDMEAIEREIAEAFGELTPAVEQEAEREAA